MKPIIGIITRATTTSENNIMYGVYDSLARSIKESGGISIGILPSSIKDIDLSLIDGLIFQGGDDFTDYERELLLLAHKNNIKTLGICLGMQLMGAMFNGSIIDIENHKYKDKNYVHKVILKEDSTLYKIFKQKEIMVNSRHKSALKNTSLSIIGISDDDVIEAIEDKNKDFFLGVQWHPETMITYDKLQQELFNYFVNICRRTV